MEPHVAHLALQDRLLAWLDTHKRQILWGAITVAVVASAIGIFVWRQKERQKQAGKALTRLTNPALLGIGQPATPEALLQIAAEYSGTAAAERALLLAGADYFIAGKYQQALEQFKRYLRQYQDARYTGQALLGVASSLDVMSQTNAAITAYRDIVDHHSASDVAPQAAFALARLYEAQDQLEQARDLYQRVAQLGGAGGSISVEAAMRLEELMTRHPGLASTKSATPDVAMPDVPMP